jgi:hypothetical protein
LIIPTAKVQTNRIDKEFSVETLFSQTAWKITCLGQLLDKITEKIREITQRPAHKSHCSLQ